MGSAGPKQSFFFAFLHSSIPHDVWDDIRSEMILGRHSDHLLESPQVETLETIEDIENIEDVEDEEGVIDSTDHQIMKDTSVSVDKNLENLKRSGSSVLFSDEDEGTQLL